ncbi:MAG: DNA methyltransferase, partial [Promethearchaeota archaeon]
MGRTYELIYPKKAAAKKVLEETAAAKLEEVRKFRKHARLVTDDWLNMLVFGDNLGVLKAFMTDPQIKGKVDLIYIDPPFATKQEFRAGKERVATISAGLEDEIAYEDILTGADFLEFIRKRLIFLRELLSAQGSIYLHIDSKKGHYLKILMDEVFGEEHFIND